MSHAATTCEQGIAYLKAKLDEADPDPGTRVSLDRDQSPVLRDLGNRLLVAYVLDRGTHFELINHRQMDADGLSPEQLHQIGLRNLAAAANKQGIQVHPYNSIFAVIAGGNIEASLLLLDDLWERAFRELVPGRYLVAAPARDLLAFGDADDPSVVVELRALIARAEQGADHLLTRQLFVRSERAWIPLRD